jgi:hypothetical protein
MNNVDQLIHEVTVFAESNQLHSDRCELGPRKEGITNTAEIMEDNLM